MGKKNWIEFDNQEKIYQEKPKENKIVLYKTIFLSWSISVKFLPVI